MPAVNELLHGRGTGPHRTDAIHGHTAVGYRIGLRTGVAPLQELWWFTDTGSLVLVSTDATIRSQGLKIAPGSLAVITERNASGQQDVFGSNVTAARLTLFSKDGVNAGRLQAFSEEASVDWTIDITPTGSAPEIELSSTAGQSHDITTVRTAFDDPQAQHAPRNVLLDDGSRAWADPPTLQHSAEARVELDPAFALIDVVYSHFDGAGQAGLLAHVDGGENSWTLITNSASMLAAEKMSGRANAGSSIRMLMDSQIAYGRVTCAQMASGKWQCWLRTHSIDHRYAEAMFVITATSPTVPPILRLDSGHTTTSAFVHTVKKYRK